MFIYNHILGQVLISSSASRVSSQISSFTLFLFSFLLYLGFWFFTLVFLHLGFEDFVIFFMQYFLLRFLSVGLDFLRQPYLLSRWVHDSSFWGFTSDYSESVFILWVYWVLPWLHVSALITASNFPCRSLLCLEAPKYLCLSGKIL